MWMLGHLPEKPGCTEITINEPDEKTLPMYRSPTATTPETPTYRSPTVRRVRSSFSTSPTRGDAARSRFTIGWSLWTFSAALGLVTTKYILVTRNYHYPLHLLFLHLAVAAVGSTCTTVRHRGRTNVAFSAPSARAVWRSRKLKGPFELLAIALSALSLPLTMQSILHLWNLVTLTMVAVSREYLQHTP